MHEVAQKGCNVRKELQDAQLAAQRAKIACEAVEAEAQKARDLKLAEFKEARKLRELELKAEQGKALSEAENEAAMREHEFKISSLDKHPPQDRASAFDPARNIRLVPPLPRKGG